MSNDMCAAVVEADAAIDAEFDSSCDYELLSCTCGVASWPRARFEYLSYLACKLHCILEDILDEWVRGKDEGKKHSRAGEARRKEEIRQQQDFEVWWHAHSF